MTPSSFAAFSRWRGVKKPFALKEPARLSLHVPTFSSEKPFNLYSSTLRAALAIEGLRVDNAPPADLTLDLQKRGAGKEFTFDLQSTLANGFINGKGSAGGFLKPDGTTDISLLSTSVAVEIESVPTALLDAYFTLLGGAAYSPSLLLGETVSATLIADITEKAGRLELELDASSCKLSANAIIKDGMITLERPLQGALTVSPALNQLLADSANLVVTKMRDPFTFYIENEGFEMPLKEIGMKGARIKYGRIDISEVVCRNTGSASTLGSIFKQSGSGDISLWFAPLEFQSKGGNTYIGRTEILYNRAYQIAIWGNLDFNRRYANMVLGLTAQSLYAALRIGDLSSNYVLTIPVTGPFDNIKIDKGAATSKITFLIARKQVAPQAGIFGQVFGIIGDLADDQSDVPPAKPPYPWSNPKKR